MKALSLLLLLATTAVAQAPASLEGIVINDSDGQPISGVQVVFVSSGVNVEQHRFGALSDRSGHFSIAALPPGSYFLHPQRFGYMYVTRNSPGAPLPSVWLRAGQHLANYTIRMALNAVITGRVVDEAGDPVPDANIEPLRPDGGFIPSARWGGWGTAWARSDDRGEFRVVVPPGRYFLSATPHNTRSTDAPEIRTDGTSDVVYGATYYPNAASLDHAAPVNAVSGRDTSGIEIRLLREQVLTVSGIVSGPDGPAPATVWLKNTRDRQNSRGIGTSSDGRFAFNRVLPGSYQLYAQGSEKRSLQSSLMELHIESTDQTDLHLSLSPGGDLSGTLDIANTPAAKHSVRLGPEGQSSGNAAEIAGGAVGEDGKFQLANIPPGRYRVLIDPMPDDAYLKSVSLDGAAAPDDILDFTHGVHGAQIRVAFGRNAGRISGIVRDQSGEPLVNVDAPVTIMLVSDRESIDPQMPMLSRDGAYSLKGIRPGKYRIAAVDLFAVGAGRPLKDLVTREDEIEIKEGDNIHKDLKLLNPEDGDAKK